VLEQVASLVEDMKKTAADESLRSPGRKSEVQRRFDVLHFEQVAEDFDEDAEDEMLDPSALLVVLGALARLTHGVAVDPGGNLLIDD